MLSPGEIAYNAYCNHTGWKSPSTDRVLPRYDLAPQRIRDSWEEAAKAVIAYVNNGPPHAQVDVKKGADE